MVRPDDCTNPVAFSQWTIPRSTLVERHGSMVKKMWSPEQTAAINKGIDTGSMDPCIEALNARVPLELNPYIVSALEWVVDEDKES